MNQRAIKILLWMIGALFLIIADNSIVIYIIFLGMLLFISCRLSIRLTLIYGTIYSIILPDNYTIIAFSALLCLYEFFTSKGKLKKDKFIVLSLYLFIIIVSALVNSTPLINVLFAILYSFTFILYYFIFSDKPIMVNDKNLIAQLMEELLYIEFFATVIRFVKMVLTGVYYDDWSIGTFGGAQQNIVMLVYSFFFVQSCLSWYRYRSKKYFYHMVLSFAIIVSTNCITLLFVLALSFLLYFIKYLVKEKAVELLILIFLLPIIMWSLIPNGYKTQIIKIANDASYRNTRVAKLNVYESTFLKIPEKDVKYFFFGAGPGSFSSRAAATCTGEYVSAYNRLFPVSISSYTEQYVYNGIHLGRLYGSSNYGSVLSLPYASIISFMGEYGILGLALILFFLIFIGSNKHRAGMIVLFLFLICFIDNYLEYAKIILSFWCCYNLLINKRKIEGEKSHYDKKTCGETK